MILDYLKMENHLSEIINNTNFSNHKNIETMYGNILNNIYESIYMESQHYLLILIIFLLTSSIISSIANLFVICIFTILFNKNLSRRFHTLLDVNKNEKNLTTIVIKPVSNLNLDDQEKRANIIEKFNKTKHSFILNQDLRLFYSLIRCLAVVDLFTCSVVVPVTVYEIWNNMKINEIFCRFFEFIRALGVISSNFIIILIAVERYLAVYAPKKFSKSVFNIRFIIGAIISVMIAIVCMLQVSVYQRTENSIIFIGICLKSEYVFNSVSARIINIIITSIFLSGLTFVSIVYIMIFRKTYQVQKKHKLRRESEVQLFKRAFNTLNEASVEKSKQSIEKAIELKIEYKISAFEKKNQKLTLASFFKNQSCRIVISVLLVAFVYFLSIIPWCLTINGLIKYNPFIHYTFLLNNTINPFIYGFLNPNIRNCGSHLLKLIYTFKFC